MLIALVLSLAMLGLGAAGYAVDVVAKQVISQIDFNEALMHGMLSVLLFAGALHVNLDDLMQQKVIIGMLASAGVVVSTC
jgi:CPA1 family monovalent cation:H+ antiporter